MSTRIVVGDCRVTLPTLAAGSVRCCVTSPPYWGLRDYGHGEQIGLEQTPDAYVAELVAVFREVRRVLTDDGTLWLNLGDSYSSMRDSKATPDTLRGDNDGTAVAGAMNRNPAALRAAGLKHKDLIGIPWRVAFALQADGWYLRSDIIWHKPNPMPESVTDRPTKAHEYVFLLSKSAKYYYDAAAIAEPATYADSRMVDGFVPKSIHGKHKGDPQSAEFRKQDNTGNRRYTGFNDRYASKALPTTRNARTVWTVTTSPYSGAHFATMPPELAERCIKAGSAKGDTVLDPFGGAGTTALVADRLGRDAILCELNPTYVELAEQRVTNDSPLFSEVIR